MLIKQVEATVTQQDEGIFEALASTYGLDRQGERVAHGAFKEHSAAGKTATRCCRWPGITSSTRPT